MLRDFKTKLFLQIAIAAGLVVIIGGILFYFGRNLKNSADEIVSVRNELETRRQRLKDFSQLKEESLVADPELETLRVALPKRDELIFLPEQIRNLGNKYDVDAEFVFGGDNEKNIDFSITLNGSYANTISFLSEQERDFFFIIPDEIDIIFKDGKYISTLKGKVFLNE